MASSFGLGYKALKALCSPTGGMNWHKAKLVPEMFKPGELEAFEWVAKFVHDHHQLPTQATLCQQFPDILQFDCPEPASYYVEHLENRLYYEKINQANVESQSLLADGKQDIQGARKVLGEALSYITAHEYRLKIVDFAKQGPELVLNAYHNAMLVDNVGQFGWPYMDKATGGLMPGDVVSFIGRPASGKTFLSLALALHNWLKGHRPLFVSMEMGPVPIMQRLVSMYGHLDVKQLKTSGFSSQTYKKFVSTLMNIGAQDEGLYVVDGNLAASVDQVYELAQQLKCDQVYIDGAYLLRHPNRRLNRYERVAENVELVKRHTSDSGMPTISSYQFSRSAVKDKKKDEQAGLEDIAFSDGIGQVSSIVLGLFQDDSVETLEGRTIRVLKGRNGESGQFRIHWDFVKMNFNEIEPEQEKTEAKLEYI